MKNNTYKKHLILSTASIEEALRRMNCVYPLELIVVNKDEIVLGSLTDGDIRRGLLKGYDIKSGIEKIYHRNYCFFNRSISPKDFKEAKRKNIKIVPQVEKNRKLVKLFNIDDYFSLLPVTAVIMAGGRGQRLRPITDNVPKPMIKLGERPIIEHNIDRLIQYGIQKFYISVNYLKNQIIDYFGDGSSKGVEIYYIEEDKPLGTVGALSLVDEFKNDILLMNSDLFTSIDFEDFFLAFEENMADIAVASIPYTVNIPYAILEENQNQIVSFKEKPCNTYYANAGIYLVKKEMIRVIPQNEYFNTTDLMQYAIDENKKIIHNPIIGYWIDIGRKEDLDKANIIYKHTDN